MQTAKVDVQKTPVSVQTQITLISIEAQTIEVREAQIAKIKGKIQDEMQDRRKRNREKQVSPISSWEHMHRTARNAEEQPHKLLPL